MCTRCTLPVMRTYSILALVLWLLVTSCGKQPTTSNHIIWKINPTSAIKTDLRLFVDSISLVPLSTNDNSLIKKVHSIDYVNNKFYINNNLTDIQVYDNNGTFLYGTKQHLGHLMITYQPFHFMCSPMTPSKYLMPSLTSYTTFFTRKVLYHLIQSLKKYYQYINTNG